MKERGTMSKIKFKPKEEPVCLSVLNVKPPVHRKKREKKQTDTSEIDNQFFLMIDGEGCNDSTVPVPSGIYQKYVLLCASTGETIYNPNGLSTGECLQWLCDLVILYPRAIFIIFGGSYDVTMWLRDLSFAQLKEIREYNDVPDKSKTHIPKTSVYTLDGKSYVYGVDYRPRKYVSITRYEVTLSHTKKVFAYKRDSRGMKIRHGRITVWDVWGFFQCRFVKAVEEYGLLASQTDRDFLSNMKDARNQFDVMGIEKIKDYCFLECKLGVELMNKVRTYVGELGLKLTRWDGAGAVSSALMNIHNIKDHKGLLPDEVSDVVRHSFSGGRIELIQYGHTRQMVFDADVNSAYPTITATLPTMIGEWKKTSTIDSPWALVHIKWNLSSRRARFFPFFYRDEDACISYPTRGENWVCRTEYDAYLKNQDLYEGVVELIEVWNFFPESAVTPFAFIPELAAQRLVWKRLYKKSGGNEGGQHMMAKTGLNGIFGKTAQTVGMYTDEEGEVHRPPFFNLFWASWITAASRSILFDAACTHPESVIMFATDGLFTSRARNLPYSNVLGEWELSYCKGMTFVQSGVYYSSHIEKTRGFEKGTITEEDIRASWQKKIWDVTGASNQFITFGILATSSKADTIEINMKRLANWETKERVLHLTPNGTKREYDPKYNPLQKRGPNPANKLVPTIPKWNDCDGISYPYEINMGYVQDQEELAERLQTQQ